MDREQKLEPINMVVLGSQDEMADAPLAFGHFPPGLGKRQPVRFPARFSPVVAETQNTFPDGGVVTHGSVVFVGQNRLK